MRRLCILGTVLLVTLLTQSCGTRLEMVTESVPDVDDSVQEDSSGVANTRFSRAIMDRPPVSYLEDNTPACALTGINGWDTCPTEPPAIMDVVSIEGMGPMWPFEGGVPTLTEIMLGQGTTLAAVHLVVRGVVQKGTTRCAAYPIKVPNYMNETSMFWNLYHYHCFSEVAISEYIIGTGPAILTISLHREVLSGDQLDENNRVKEEILTRFLETPESRAVTVYEGKEVILFLIPAVSTALESWQNVSDFGTWFLQQDPDGNIKVMSADIVYAETDEQRNQLTRPLEEFIEQIQQAYTERNNITDGKVGTYPATLPSIVTDANFLQNYYTSVGAIYDETDESTVLPPPVPGEDDLAPPIIPINDETTETTPDPGEEPTTPLPTDDAGTSTTTTTTTVIEETTTTGTETTTTSAPTTTVVETDPTTSTSTTIASTTTTTTEPTTTTTEATVTETVTGTTTTTTEPSGENDDSPEEQATTTSTFPSENENPPTEGSSPEEENNPIPGVSPTSGGDDSEDNTATVPSGDDSGLSPTTNRDPNDDQTT